MKHLSYQDVLLVANYSELNSRDDADTSVNFCGRKFALPILPANMEDVIDIHNASFLSQNDYFYIYHRFGYGQAPNMSNQLDTYMFTYYANLNNWKLISISTGVNDDSLKALRQIKNNCLRVDFITVDVAHGHHKKVRERVEWIKQNLPNTKIIAGNIMTNYAARELASWGVDAVKIGIGQGSICTTRFQTGFSMPMFSCVQQCRGQYHEEGSRNTICNIPMIADGGVQQIGDIAKALVAGATMVMSGKLFASCIDSPAKIVTDNGLYLNKKQYRGSTSFAAKKHNKHIEGKTIDLEADITFAERLQEMKEALQSSISYSGGKDLSAFQYVRWIEGK